MIKIDYNYGQASVRVLIGLLITVISALRDRPLSLALSLSWQSGNCKLVRNWFATDSIEFCMRPQGNNMDAWAF